MFSLACLCFRALFYHQHEDAAKTKASVKRSNAGKDSPDQLSSDVAFPLDGWSSDSSKLPLVDAFTVLAHLMRMGKTVSSSKLMVVEHYGPRPESPELPPPEAVTSRPCSWGVFGKEM